MARYSDDFRASAVLMLQAAGYPDTVGALTRVSEHLGVSRTTLRRWFKRESNPPPDELVREKTFDLVAAIRGEIAAILGEMPDARSEANYRELATAFGIFTDKLQLLSGEPTGREETHWTVKHEYPDNQPSVSLPAPARHRRAPGALQDHRDGAAVGQDDAGDIPN